MADFNKQVLRQVETGSKPVRSDEEFDESQEAVRNVDKLTDSEPVNGEDLLGSEDLKRQLREAKERLKGEAKVPRDGREDRKS